MKQDWQATERQALDWLRSLIRLNTINPPGNERIAVDYLRPVFEQAGVKPAIVESEPTRASLVARLKGRDSSLPPLMLSAHTDVVPVERELWSRDPLGAEVVEGFVWGRGALDMKAKLAMDVAVATAIARASATPGRDLIVAAVADEEAGSELGAEFLVNRHPELVRAGFVLNELGGFTLHLGDKRFYPIQVAEKGFVTVKMIFRGQPGHGSMPRSDSAIAKLADALSKIAQTPMRRRITPLVQSVLDNFQIPAEVAPPMLRAMMANTVSPNIIRGGYKDNVIPGEAWAILDGRTLPGDDPESFMAELRGIVGDEPSFELVKTAPPVEATPKTALFDLIVRQVEAADRGARAVPWMIPGATDNKFYARLGAICYGFAPVKLTPDVPFGSLFHGNDERIPVAGFLWGLKVYTEVVLSFLDLRFEDIFS